MTNIFSSLPSSVDTLCSASDLAAVRGVFERQPSVWIRADVVAERVGWPCQRTAERVRRVVNELLEVGVPIVHSHQGFMLTVDAIDVRRAREDLRARVAGLSRKDAAYARIEERLERGQLSLSSFSVRVLV